MLDYIVEEPNIITDSPQRCYKLPFVATEALCCDSEHIRNVIFTPVETSEGVFFRILDRLFSFITQPPGQQKPGTPQLLPMTQLNHTLGGYFNKIVSFWLIKETQNMLMYICRERHVLIPSFFDSQLWGHTSSITDLVVRICTVKDIQGLDPEEYKALRQDILQHCVNSLQENAEDDFVTEQVFELLVAIVRRCYQMY